MVATSNKDMTSIQHDEEQFQDATIHQIDRRGCETDLALLPKGYYYSRFFIGSMMATGLGAWAAVASFVCHSPISDASSC